jgi:Holliday junction resolvase
MSGRRSRSNGARTERSTVNALQAKGLAAVRVSAREPLPPRPLDRLDV